MNHSGYRHWTNWHALQRKTLDWLTLHQTLEIQQFSMIGTTHALKEFTPRVSTIRRCDAGFAACDEAFKEKNTDQSASALCDTAQQFVGRYGGLVVS